MNDTANDNCSREMEEHNQMLKEKSKAYKKLAEALNDNYKSQLPKPGIKMKAPRKIRPT